MTSPPPEQEKRKRGRPTVRSDELQDELLRRITEGQSLRQICREPSMPDTKTFLNWLHDDRVFYAKYAQAREGQADFMDALILETANRSTPATAASDRVKIDAYKWRASKLKPKVYGDKLDFTTDGESLNRTAAIEASARRAQQYLDSKDKDSEAE